VTRPRFLLGEVPAQKEKAVANDQRGEEHVRAAADDAQERNGRSAAGVARGLGVAVHGAGGAQVAFVGGRATEEVVARERYQSYGSRMPVMYPGLWRMLGALPW
jgi:hypothetical protein